MGAKQHYERRVRMSIQENRSWTKLDNAAKAFPPTVQKSDTRVFRFSCELNEDIDRDILQAALDKAIKEFPNYLCVMRQGLFWYYLEQCDIKPVVTKEDKRPCAQLYKSGYRTLLFRVTYFRRRINLEIFHALSDGTGALHFLREIVLKYIIEKYGEELGGEIPYLESISSAAEKDRDSFGEYYRKKDKVKKEKIEMKKKSKEEKRLAKKEEKEKRKEKHRQKKLLKEKAYRFRGDKRDDDTLTVVEGDVSVKETLALAHKYDATLTAFITAVYIYSIGRELTERNKNTPVVIALPVNLRKYFSSQTSRNFFAMINIKYTFKNRDDSFEDVIEGVKKSMKEQITKERLSQVMYSFSKLEHNFFVRISPLILKDVVIQTERKKSDKFNTSVVSNIGAVKMPERVQGYIKAFSIISSTLGTQLCLCSYGDRLRLGFTTAYTELERQKTFFRTLANMGLQTEIFCNDFNES